MPNPTDVASIEIFIQSPDSRIIQFNIESLDTIKYVKSIIFKKEKIPIDKQILYFYDQKLDNHRTLSSYDISDQSVLILKVIKPKLQMYAFLNQIPMAKTQNS